MPYCSVIGIDCATVASNVGLARARFHEGRWQLLETLVCSHDRPPVKIVTKWLRDEPETLLALDAPLGWPAELGPALAPHRAGDPLTAPIETLFNRATDRQVQARTGKRPLEVGADRIARTAWAALALLEAVRQASGHRIGLAWHADGAGGPAAIEVYPAATLIAHGLPTRGYKRPSNPARPTIARWLQARLEGADVDLAALEAHALDAVLCVAAGIDFLAGEAIAPEVPAIARREGWIWVKG